jgi:hypothetical protein
MNIVTRLKRCNAQDKKLEGPLRITHAAQTIPVLRHSGNPSSDIIGKFVVYALWMT